MPSGLAYAESEIPTNFGSFRVVVYRFGTLEHLAVVSGDVSGRENVLVRVHSECLTGEVLGSLLCDCRAQLDMALQKVAAHPPGIVVYLRQEGRGIGLGNKIKAYALQAQGRDTVEANTDLGFAADLRSYEEAASILADLGVASVRLLTNNPQKLAGLRGAGVVVTGREPLWVEPQEHNRRYLETKQAKLGHLKKGEVER